MRMLHVLVAASALAFCFTARVRRVGSAELPGRQLLQPADSTREGLFEAKKTDASLPGQVPAERPQ